MADTSAKISISKHVVGEVEDKQTSMPVIHTGIYPHMPIAVTKPALVSFSHVIRDCRPVCHTFLYKMCVTKILHVLALGANHWAKVYQKGR